MADDDMLLITADMLSMATHKGEVVAIFDLSSSQVYPRQLGLRLLPAEARAFAQQLKELADEAESGSPKSQ